MGSRPAWPTWRDPSHESEMEYVALAGVLFVALLGSSISDLCSVPSGLEPKEDAKSGDRDRACDVQVMTGSQGKKAEQSP